MPIFRYHCIKCDRDLELLLPRWSSPAVCPECGSTDLKKLNTTFAAVSTNGCPHRDSCEAAGGHSCGCGCGCGHHH